MLMLLGNLWKKHVSAREKRVIERGKR